MLPSAQRQEHRPANPPSQLGPWRNSKMAMRRQLDSSIRAAASRCCDDHQAIEFRVLIRLSPDFLERRKCQIVVNRNFTRPAGANTISQPQPFAYALRLCHYADFYDRFNGVTHG